jgi:hypothetical protein
MLTVQQTVQLFQVPVKSSLVNVGRIQKALLRLGSTNEDQALASLRCLSILYTRDIAPLLLGSVDQKIALDIMTPGVTPAMELISGFEPYAQTLSLAVEEARGFLPSPTADILNDYNTQGSPVDRLGVATLVVLAANLQGS